MRQLRGAIAATLVIVASCSGGDAEPDPLYPLRTLLAPASYNAPLVSPDGRWVSYFAPVDGAANLFVAPAGAPDSARQLTHRTGRGLQATDVSGNTMYRWTPDSRRIVFPEDQNGNERWNLHVVDVETGAERALTPLPGVAVQLMAFDERDPRYAAVAIKDRHPVFPDLYRLDLETGERTLILANDAMLAVVPDRTLRPRLGMAFAADGSVDLYRPTAGGGWELVWDLTPEDVPALSASSYRQAFGFDGGNRRFYLFDSEGRDVAALVALDPETGRRDSIAQDARVDIAAVLYHPKTFALQAYATIWTRTEWTVVDTALREDFARLRKLADGDFEIESRSDDQRRWVVHYRLSDSPDAYYLYDRETGGATRLFVATPELEGMRFSKLHPFELETPDGLPLVSYYLLPPWTDRDGDGKPTRPVPAVVLVHGGPSDERAQYAFGGIVHWFANRGYAVLYVNYRGSAGFGKRYMNAQNLEWGGKMHEDVLQQVDWAAAQGIVDRDKVAIVGGSYGGYEVLVGMTMTPEAFACGVDLVGPSNLERFMPHWNVDRMAKVVGDPRTEEGRAHLRSRSPINFAGQTTRPVLIGQGSNDSRVPKYQSDTVVAAMQAADAPVVYAVYPDEGHGLLRPANSYSFWAIGEQFLAQCLGGRAAPIGDALDGASVVIETGADYIPGLRDALARRDSLAAGAGE
ncbi:MAG: prolyl oligopeptidase family serine peptidase [Gemmatimonadales bacterium]